MPNGRSGGFPIGRADLQQLLSTFPSDAALGAVLDDREERVRGRSPWVRATASQIVALVSLSGLNPVPVEEQYGESYVIHLCNSPEYVWILVDADSPICAELRTRHHQWMREHPNYRDWIAF